MKIKGIKTLAKRAVALLVTLLLTATPAFAASTFTDHLWQFVGGPPATTNLIDFVQGASRIYENSELHIATDNYLYLNAPVLTIVEKDMLVVGTLTAGALVGPLTGNASTATALAADPTDCAANTFATTIAANGNLTCAALTDASVPDALTIASTTGVSAAVTRATGATGSFQSVWGDLTYEGAAGGTSTYHAGMMGNFMGDTLTNTGSDIHAGVIGKYEVTTSDALTGAKAGLVGEAGTDVADAAIMAVLGGDTGTLTPTAAYGVQYFNSTAASKFDYGLDLFHAETADYINSAVEYGVADIRLSSGATIGSGAGAPTGSCISGSLYLRTDGAADSTAYTCIATAWVAVSNEP